MIIPSGRVDQTLGVHLQKIYKTNAGDDVDRVSRRDVVAISKFSALVEHGRACAMAVPDLRADRVQQARTSLESGSAPKSADLAAAMINSAVEGRV